MTRWIASALLWAHRRVSRCRGTRYLLLCALEGRKSGRVTVGESRLPVHMVLGTLRVRGVDEAWAAWPQLTGEELSVLARLVEDVHADGLYDEDDLRGLRDDIATAVAGEETSPEAVATRVVDALVSTGVVVRTDG